MRLIAILSVLVLCQKADAAYSGSIPNGSPVPKNSDCSVAAKPAGGGGGRLQVEAGGTERKADMQLTPRRSFFKGPLSTEVLATGPGIVEKVGTNNHLGRYVVINHSRNVKSSYGHLEASTVKRGQQVGIGDVIGKIGKSGATTSPGLHYMITQGKRSLNPLQFIKTDAPRR